MDLNLETRIEIETFDKKLDFDLSEFRCCQPKALP